MYKKGNVSMPYCPIRKEKVVYLCCMECEDTLECASLKRETMGEDTASEPTNSTNYDETS